MQVSHPEFAGIRYIDLDAWFWYASVFDSLHFQRTLAPLFSGVLQYNVLSVVMQLSCFLAVRMHLQACTETRSIQSWEGEIPLVFLLWLEFGDSVGTLADCRLVSTLVQDPSRSWIMYEYIRYLESIKVTRFFGIVMHCDLPECRTLLRLFGARCAMQRTRHMNGTHLLKWLLSG